MYSDDGCPAESQGFCLLNNAMIAAAYAKYSWRDVVARVAIVDFDVHAGNGSCAIIRNCEDHRLRSLCFCSELCRRALKRFAFALNRVEGRSVVVFACVCRGQTVRILASV